MLERAEPEERRYIDLYALLVRCGVELDRTPDIVEVRTLSPEIAAEMESLGYMNLSVALFRAFIRKGFLRRISQGREIMLGT
jgi:hypothetical protein